ncbi:hypothetical protein ACLOJK_007794, partial [Asimina triloba]
HLKTTRHCISSFPRHDPSFFTPAAVVATCSRRRKPPFVDQRRSSEQSLHRDPGKPI